MKSDVRESSPIALLSRDLLYRGHPSGPEGIQNTAPIAVLMHL
jgi:hypothetical protein